MKVYNLKFMYEIDIKIHKSTFANIIMKTVIQIIKIFRNIFCNIKHLFYDTSDFVLPVI